MESMKKEDEVGKEQNKWQLIIKNVVLIILGLGFGILIGYQFSGKSPEPWKPILETSNYDYLDDVVNNALEKMKEAASQGENNQTLKSTPAIQNVEQWLFKLKYYYLPITEVRQLIFDADRLFYLGQQEEAHQKLISARALLESTAKSDLLADQKPLTELVSLLDDLIISLSKNSPNIASKFHEVGHRVNMMAYKGELIISGVKIPETN
jgi:hypothetical protein